MLHSRVSSGMGGLVASLMVLVVTLALSRAATAGDPDVPSGDPDVPTQSSLVLIQPVDHSDGSLDPQKRSHFFISGDPDSPLGEQGDPDNPMGEQGDPDSPTGKKNGSSPLILAIERMSRSQVRIHVAFLGDPDNPTPALGNRTDRGWHLNAYDVTGRLRRQWDVQNVLSQGGNVIWDLRDDRGAPVASGIYFVQFSGQSSAVTERVIALR